MQTPAWYYWTGAVTGTVEGRIVIVDLLPYTTATDDPKSAATVAIAHARNSYPTLTVRRCRLLRMDTEQSVVIDHYS
jgi:hypothetical protein